jgi:hypothetical protein
VSPRVRKVLLGLFFVLIVAPAILLVLYTWAMLSYSYSSGERVGYVQKLSKKGWICKTWEGELAMANLPGAMPQIFAFTIRDEAVAHRIQEAEGRRVSIHYEQHVGLPTSCFGDTSYFVTSVRGVQNP